MKDPLVILHYVLPVRHTDVERAITRQIFIPSETKPVLVSLEEKESLNKASIEKVWSIQQYGNVFTVSVQRVQYDAGGTVFSCVIRSSNGGLSVDEFLIHDEVFQNPFEGAPQASPLMMSF